MYAVHRAENAWRYDPVDGQWTVVARNRRVTEPMPLGRPPGENRLDDERSCPFCQRGHEHVIDEVEAGGGERAVALPSPTPLAFVEHGPPPAAPFLEGGALGAHELFVPLGASYHGAAPSALSDGALEALFVLLHRRHGDLARDLRLGALHFALLPALATRVGHLAGVLLGTPFGARPAAPPETCPVIADVEHARRSGRLLVEEGELTAYVPFAPRGTVHVRVTVGTHPVSRLPPQEEETRAHARVIGRLLRALDEAVPEGRAQLTLTRIPLRPHEGRVPPLLADLELPLESDHLLGRSLGVRITSMPPEDLADVLRTALRPAPTKRTERPAAAVRNGA